MTTIGISLKISGLARKDAALLAAKAKRRGLTPESYAKELIQEGLALEQEARVTSFDQLLGPVRKGTGPVAPQELQRLVDQARTRHHERMAAKKR
ncbi:MAG: hypothetical protein WCI73_02020 [Phycisphaerae bacterium]